MGVSFDLNEALPNISRPLSTSRNARFMGRGDKMEQNNDVRLISPTMPHFQKIDTVDQYVEKLTMDYVIHWFM
jgi:hypothetical protein